MSVLVVIGAIASAVGIGWLAWSMTGRALVTRPRLRAEFSKREIQDKGFLMIEFFNDPLHGFPWNVFNIKREGIDEFAVPLAHLIEEQGVLIDLDPAVHDKNGGGHGDTLSLPASMHPLFWLVVSHDGVGPSVIDANGTQTYIDFGTHELLFVVHADDVYVHVITHRLVVGPDTFKWVGNPKRVASGLRKRILDLTGLRLLTVS